MDSILAKISSNIKNRHKTKQPYAKSFIGGAPRGNRTPNLQFRKLALCPVEL